MNKGAKPPIQVRVCPNKCAGLECCRCCGRSSLRVAGSTFYDEVYDKYCCHKSRREADELAVHGNMKAAGEKCGRFSPGWRHKPLEEIEK